MIASVSAAVLLPASGRTQAPVKWQATIRHRDSNQERNTTHLPS